MFDAVGVAELDMPFYAAMCHKRSDIPLFLLLPPPLKNKNSI